MNVLELKGIKIISKTAQKSIAGGGLCMDNFACCMKACIGSYGVKFCKEVLCAI